MIDQQLSNPNVALKGALAKLALDTFNISDFFSQREKDQEFGPLNALAGLGTGYLPLFQGSTGC